MPPENRTLEVPAQIGKGWNDYRPAWETLFEYRIWKGSFDHTNNVQQTRLKAINERSIYIAGRILRLL